MRFWQAVTMEPLDERCELAQFAETAGFTGFSVGDHLITPARLDSPYPYTADHKVLWDPSALFPDPWQTISVMASATKNLKFMTSIYILPLRDVFTVAKALSTAAVISNNRVIFGAGVGWMKEEFSLTGQDFDSRGARTDEMLEIIAALLKGGMVEYAGKYHHFPAVQMSPVPTRPVPVIIGGESDAAMRRAAKADGWLTAPRFPEEFDALVKRFLQARNALGRTNSPATIVALVKGKIDFDGCRRLEDLGITDIKFLNWHLSGKDSISLDDKKAILGNIADQLIAR